MSSINWKSLIFIFYQLFEGPTLHQSQVVALEFAKESLYFCNPSFTFEEKQQKIKDSLRQ